MTVIIKRVHKGRLLAHWITEKECLTLLNDNFECVCDAPRTHFPKIIDCDRNKLEFTLTHRGDTIGFLCHGDLPTVSVDGKDQDLGRALGSLDEYNAGLREKHSSTAMLMDAASVAVSKFMGTTKSAQKSQWFVNGVPTDENEAAPLLKDVRLLVKQHKINKQIECIIHNLKLNKITHQDISIYNMCIDKYGNLSLIDFGDATVASANVGWPIMVKNLELIGKTLTSD